MADQHRRTRIIRLGPAAIGALMLCAIGVAADPVRQELSFASGLIERGFPDFAESVLDAVLAEHPGRAAEARGIRAELWLSQRKFDQAVRIVDEMPASTEAGRSMRIKLANAYYRAGDVDQAQALYEAFFEQFDAVPSDPGAREAYQTAALYCAAMLDAAGDYAEAAAGLERLLDIDHDREARRAVAEKIAKLLLKHARSAAGEAQRKDLGRIRQLIEDIEYGGPFWVGRGALLRAETAWVEGDPQTALDILRENRARFAQIEASLREAGSSLAQSPRAGYLHLRGAVLETIGRGQAEDVDFFQDPGGDEAKRTLAQALNSFAAVLKKYPDSEAATDAALGMKRVEDLLIAKGAKLKRSAAMQAAVPKHPGELYRTAEALFRQGEYEGATDEFLRLLNQFPQTSATPRALTFLAKAYVKLDDPLMSRVVLDYLGERFAGQSDAARGCLILATFYGQEDRSALRLAAYQAFLEHFPRHPKAAQVLYLVGRVRQQTGEGAAAAARFKQLLSRYPDSRYALNALMTLGADAYRAERYEKAYRLFDRYGAVAPEGVERAKALMLAADCRLRQGRYVDAFRSFRGVAGALDPADPNNPYYVDPEQASTLRRIHAQAFFQQGYSLSRVPAPEETRPALLANAIKIYDAFLNAYPRSALAPKALAAKGGIYLQLDRMEEASATFESLAAAYPDTPEGKSSLVTLVEAAVKLGKLDLAGDAVKRMVDAPAAFSAEMFARVGRLMLNQRMQEQAIQAYENVLRSTQDPDLRERGYFGLGESYFRRGECEQAIAHFEALIRLNHRTGYLFDARFMMAQAYRRCERYAEGIDALRDIFALDRNSVRVQQANFELARIQEAQGRVDDAYASYLRMGLNPDPTRRPALMDIHRDATLKAAAYAMERGEWDTVALLVDQFIKFWPDDEEVAAMEQRKREALLEQATEAPAEPNSESAG